MPVSHPQGQRPGAIHYAAPPAQEGAANVVAPSSVQSSSMQLVGNEASDGTTRFPASAKIAGRADNLVSRSSAPARDDDDVRMRGDSSSEEDRPDQREVLEIGSQVTAADVHVHPHRGVRATSNAVTSRSIPWYS